MRLFVDPARPSAGSFVGWYATIKAVRGEKKKKSNKYIESAMPFVIRYSLVVFRYIADSMILIILAVPRCV